MNDLMREFEGQRFLIIPGNYDYFGGAERQSLILAKALSEDVGCHVDFLGWGGNGILAEKVRELGLKPWVFPLQESQGRLRLAAQLHTLARFIKREIKPDYLLPFVGYHSKMIGLIWKQTGAKFTWWNQRDEGRRVYGSRIERKLMRSLPSIVSNSYEGRDFLIEKFNLTPQRVKVINNGVVIPADSNDMSWRENLGLAKDDVLLTMVANLTRFKDHDTLLRAFAIVRVSKDGKKCKLVLAGRHGETAQDLKALAFDLKLGDSVEMVGVVDPIDSLVCASDVIVHSSTKEGCPNAVLEAMAQSRCVVGTDISGMRQALGQSAVGKYLASPGDAGHLANLIIQLIDFPGDRIAAGLENRRRIETEFSVRHMTEQVLETIRECRI